MEGKQGWLWLILGCEIPPSPGKQRLLCRGKWWWTISVHLLPTKPHGPKVSLSQLWLVDTQLLLFRGKTTPILNLRFLSVNVAFQLTNVVKVIFSIFSVIYPLLEVQGEKPSPILWFPLLSPFLRKLWGDLSVLALLRGGLGKGGDLWILLKVP